jgi:hypothetical protein
MGSTTISLAKGLMKNDKREHCSIYAFDQFIWEEWMNPYVNMVKKSYISGESFLEEVQWRIRKYSKIVNLVEMDLSDYRWEHGSIDILLVDAMKNWELTKSIASSFFPYITENGLLIHQDYKHFYTPWIHILQYRLRECFEIRDDVPGGATVAFNCIRCPGKQELSSAVNFKDISIDEVRSAFDYSIGLVNPDQQSTIAAAHIMYFVHACDRDRSRQLLEEYSTRRLPVTPDFEQVSSEVAKLC